MFIRNALGILCTAVPAIVMFASNTAYAEAGIIMGQVRNAATKAPIPDVVITVTSPAMEGEQVVVTDAKGQFRVPGLLPSESYTIAADCENFRPLKRTGISVTSGSAVQINLDLLPESSSAAEQVITVSRAPVIDVGSSRIATSLSLSVRTAPAATRMGGGAAPNGPSSTGVRTGEWDDNANFREFGRWMTSEGGLGASNLDTSVRRFIVVRDAAGKAVPSCPVEIRDTEGKTITLLTTSQGRAMFFPRAEALRGNDFVATAACQQTRVSQSFSAAAGDGIVDLKLATNRVLPDAPFVDVAFVIDTTGSMSEEIQAMRGTLEKVTKALSKVGIRPRVGLVEYRDVGDEFVTRTYPMTTDVDSLQTKIAALKADGGGDAPEHVNQALRTAVRQLDFRPESMARLVFLIGDAPPHLDYPNDEGYVHATREANHKGIQIFTIAASGMNPLGQVVFRQIAQYTGGTHMFVLRGGAGPQSTGGGDPRSSCGGTHTDYTSGNLDELILSKVRAAIAAKDADVLRIPGLHKDEKDLPCAQQVVAIQ